MSKQVITREKLYELVWSMPISKIGPKFGVSDVAISKICSKLKVPRPSRGYWARLAHGYSALKPPLPAIEEGAADTYELNPQLKPRRAAILQKKKIPQVLVKSRVDSFHKVIVAIKAKLANGWTDRYHRICTDPSTGVSVSKGTLPRACRILDTLIRELEKRGFTVSVEERGLTVWVEKEAIRIELLEPSKREPKKKTKWGYEYQKYFPSGCLSLTLWSIYVGDFQTSWSDSEAVQLEDRLGEIVALFEVIPNTIQNAKERENQRRLKLRREQLCQRRKQDIIKLTGERAARVEKLIDDLDKARAVRTWIKIVEESENPPASTQRLARWAKHYADHLDPLLNHKMMNLVL